MGRDRRRWGVASVLMCALFFGLPSCREAPNQTLRRDGDPPPAAPARIVRPAPSGPLACADLQRPPRSAEDVLAETIFLRPLGDGKKVYISKVGIIVTFDRQEFLAAARCQDRAEAVRYIEAETGFSERAPIMDAFQAYYVAAALLDAGRADVRLPGEASSRPSIARDSWSEVGCNGQCRGFGRQYRLADTDRRVFLKISDTLAH